MPYPTDRAQTSHPNCRGGSLCPPETVRQNCRTLDDPNIINLIRLLLRKIHLQNSSEKARLPLFAIRGGSTVGGGEVKTQIINIKTSCHPKRRTALYFYIQFLISSSIWAISFCLHNPSLNAVALPHAVASFRANL